MTWQRVCTKAPFSKDACILLTPYSPENPTRFKVQDLVAIQEEFRPRKGRPISRLANRPAHPEPNGARGGKDIDEASRRMATRLTLVPQQNEVASHLEDATDVQEGVFPNDDRTQKYGNLLFLLQSEPRHIAHLCRLVSMSEIDSLLQTVMFTIYGNQYESREEHLLLTMFQVWSAIREAHARRRCDMAADLVPSPSSPTNSTTPPTTRPSSGPTRPCPG